MVSQKKLKMNCARTAKFSDYQMKQDTERLPSIRFFQVLSFTITICTWGIATKTKLPQKYDRD